MRIVRMSVNMFFFFFLLTFFSASSAMAIDPDKELKATDLKPAIPVFDVPKVTITATGILKKKEFTSYMYGTHVLTTTTMGNDKSYALKSSKIDLNKFIGQTVTVTGEWVDGTPVNGGPKLIDVSSIR